MTFLQQLISELNVVKDLSVEGDAEGTVAVMHGLLPAGEIDDAQPGVTKTHVRVFVEASFIWSTVPQSSSHPANKVPIAWTSTAPHYSANTAHFANPVLKCLNHSSVDVNAAQGASRG